MVSLTPELAELAGIHAGDGHLRYDGKRKELEISGDIEEKEFYDSTVVPLFRQIFSINLTGREFPTKSTYGIVIRDLRVLATFKDLGFPSGNKSLLVRVPTVILETDNVAIIAAFLRGYFDTDGSIFFMRKSSGKYLPFKRKFHYYPRILLGSIAHQFLDDISILLRKLNIRHSQYVKKRELPWHPYKTISIAGARNVDCWMQLVGSRNPAKLSRYLIWKEHGFCPPQTTYAQRRAILQGKCDPAELYGPTGI